MVIRDLIKLLEEKIVEHEKFRYLDGVDMMGEADIHIDVFEEITIPGMTGAYLYRGASRNIEIEQSNDGCLLILSAFVKKDLTKSTT